MNPTLLEMIDELNVHLIHIHDDRAGSGYWKAMVAHSTHTTEAWGEGERPDIALADALLHRMDVVEGLPPMGDRLRDLKEKLEELDQ